MFDNKDFFVKLVKIIRSVYQGSGMSAVHLVLIETQKTRMLGKLFNMLKFLT